MSAAVADIRVELLAVRAQIDRAIAKLDEAPAAAPAGPAELFVSMSEYATRRVVSLATVKRWRKAGMPVSEMGRAVRVELEPADEWVRINGKKGKPVK